MKGLINEALASSRFEDATEIQTAVLVVLNAVDQGSGLDTELVRAIHNCLSSESQEIVEMRLQQQCTVAM